MLNLPIEGTYFRLIESGQKAEEYREIKPYWTVRFFKPKTNELKHDKVCFKLGYAKNAPTMIFEIDSIEIGKVKPEIAKEGMDIVYVIKLGKRIDNE